MALQIPDDPVTLLDFNNDTASGLEGSTVADWSTGRGRICIAEPTGTVLAGASNCSEG